MALTEQEERELRQQVQELSTWRQQREQQEREAQLRNLPADQRPAYERQMALEERARALQEREDQLSQAALIITRKELTQKYFLKDEIFEGATSIAEMNERAQREIMNFPPERLEQIAALKRQLETAPTDPNTGLPVVPAAGTETQPPAGVTTPPAGVGTGAGGGTAPVTPSPAQEITKEFANKGASSMDEWLARKRQIPMEDIRLGTDGGLPPAPAYTQEQAGVASPAQPTPALTS